MEKVVPIKEECVSGDRTYQVSGKLYGAKSRHCSRNRKAFGVQASVSACAEPEKFVWISGEPRLISETCTHAWRWTTGMSER
jgi:hypothetical protein